MAQARGRANWAKKSCGVCGFNWAGPLLLRLSCVLFGLRHGDDWRFVVQGVEVAGHEVRNGLGERMAIASDANDGGDGNGKEIGQRHPETLPQKIKAMGMARAGMKAHVTAHQFRLNEIADQKLDNGRDCDGQQFFEAV